MYVYYVYMANQCPADATRTELDRGHVLFTYLLHEHHNIVLIKRPRSLIIMNSKVCVFVQMRRGNMRY